MARKPNYDLERKDRERAKSLKSAARVAAKTKPAVAEGELQLPEEKKPS